MVFSLIHWWKSSVRLIRAMANKSLEWFREILENIRVDVDRSRYLEELQIATSSLCASDLVAIVPNLQLNIIFDCLNTSEK